MYVGMYVCMYVGPEPNLKRTLMVMMMMLMMITVTMKTTLILGGSRCLAR